MSWRRRDRSTHTTVHTVNHKGVEIVYDSFDDIWRYTLRGRDHTSKSLGIAMKEIDKPMPKGGKPFERVEVMTANRRSWNSDKDTWVKVTVTSIATTNYTTEVWTIDKAKQRAKVRPDTCYLITPQNLEVMKQITELSVQIEALQKRKSKMYGQLETLIVEKEE
jgi:hypothetical protein